MRVITLPSGGAYIRVVITQPSGGALVRVVLTQPSCGAIKLVMMPQPIAPEVFFKQGWLRWRGYSLILRWRNAHARVVALTSAIPMPSSNEYVHAGSCIRTHVLKHRGSAISMDMGLNMRGSTMWSSHGVQYASMGAIWGSPGMPLPLKTISDVKNPVGKIRRTGKGTMQPYPAQSSNIHSSGISARQGGCPLIRGMAVEW